MRSLNRSGEERGALSQLLLPWLAALLMCFIVIWGTNLMLRGQTDASIAIILAWTSLFAIPALSSAVAVLLLPRPSRARLGMALGAGVPVVAAYCAWRLFTAEFRAGYVTVLVSSAVLIAIAAAVSLVLGVLGRTQDP